MVMRMLNKIDSGIEKLREYFNKELESIIKNQEDLKNTVSEIKNTSGEINSRLSNTEQISNLEDRLV